MKARVLIGAVSTALLANNASGQSASTEPVVSSSIGSGQAYPAKPVKFMVGFAAGGDADVTARMPAPKLSALLGQQIIIENRGGSGGMLATDAVAKAAGIKVE